VGLFKRNVRDGGNDRQLRNMIRAYGLPPQWLEINAHPIPWPRSSAAV